VIDAVIKRELPQGPGWRRYNHDGYGQKEDGTAYNGTGVGRSWPILTGERGHYEIAAGGDPALFISAMENFANAGGMISEQLWDEDDPPECRMKRGQPTGACPQCARRCLLRSCGSRVPTLCHQARSEQTRGVDSAAPPSTILPRQDLAVDLVGRSRSRLVG
jgi:hypothetical protein